MAARLASQCKFQVTCSVKVLCEVQHALLSR